MKSKIKQFIDENGLNFVGQGSELNSDCTVISGYADYVGASEDDVIDAIKESLADVDVTLKPKVKKDLSKVFKFARTYSYGKWWNTAEAKGQYTF